MTACNDLSDRTVTVSDWWELCHGSEGHEEHRWYLTGSKGPEVWSALNIAQRLTSGKKVLNIGIGMGYCTRRLKELSCAVSALDVSYAGLEQVKDICEHTWHPSALDTLPDRYFDVAISNLVAQHMTNQDLMDQLHHVIRSLKSDGVFALQFAFQPGNRRFEISSESAHAQKAGAVLRSLGLMEKMVVQAGGDIVWASRIGLFPEYGTGWYGVNIVPAL